MTIYLLLCKCPADPKAIDEGECARNGTQCYAFLRKIFQHYCKAATIHF
jgi:hypothetical protein